MIIDKHRLHTPTVHIVELPTYQGRTLLSVVFPEQSLALATVHLESLASQATRTMQLQRIQKVLQEYNTALLVGDMNITSTGPWANTDENTKILTHHLPGYVDGWIEVHGNNGEYDETCIHGMTFDTTLNTMSATHTKFPESSRYDRALFKQWRGQQLVEWSIDSIRIVGNEPIGNDCNGEPIFISDHFGLSMELKTK
jgi:hypothetical protein